MARALEIDPINQLEENLQCTVCLKVLTDPRTLPCCHSFCKVCLEGIVKTLRDKAPRGRPIREFPCPNCRATFTLDPDKQVADMPRNHFICNMVKATAVLDRGIGVPCSHNCSQGYSVARCVTCEKFICRECLTIHNSYRGHNGHSVLTMEELSKPENRTKINDKMYCNEHSGKKLKVYCETCDQLICKDCMDFKHVKQSHSCFLVKDVANNYKELLASNNKAMEDALTEGNAFVQRLTLTTEQLDRDAENAKNKIAQRKEFVAKKVIEMLDQKAETLCKKVDEIHKDKRAVLDKQAEETKLYVENIKTSVQLSKKLVDQGTEEEIISSQKMMLDNANNLLTKREEYFKAPIPVAKLSHTSSTGKQPISENVLKGLANSLGEVYAGGFHAGPTAIGVTLTIDGTELSVERWDSQTASNDDSKSESVSKIWQTDEEAPKAYINEDHESETRAKTGRKLFGKEVRQHKFDNRRPGLHSDQKPMPEALFGETKVKLNKDFARKMEEDAEFDKILNEEDVKLNKGKLIGTWNGIYTAGQKLLSFISRFYQNENNYDQLEVPPRATEQLGQSKEPDESFPVSSLFLRFIIAYHYEEYQKLENVSEEISYEVTESKTDRNLKFFARKDVSRDTFSKTMDKFIDFYQNQNQKMHQEVIPMLPKSKNDDIFEARAKFSVVIDSAQEPDKITIYGERDNVQGALKFLKSKVGDLTTSTPSSSSKSKGEAGGSPSKGATGGSSSNAKSAAGEKVFMEKLSCVLFQNVKVSVYQGDVTKEAVDVIVNPANEHLNHSGGAAGAIVKAGGKSIQVQSDEFIKKRRYNSLNPGEVVTTKAGNLPCNFIIHAVGPRWDNYYFKDAPKNALYNAVVNSLNVANQHGATSISMPAISSGIFGVPVKICAEVLFTAVTKFAQSAPKSIPLKDIRFVNIDEPTSQVFAQEMVKRFGCSIQRENVEEFHFNNFGRNAKQYEQSQSNAWKQSLIAAAKATAAVDPKTPKVTYEDGRDSRPGSDNKGSQGGKSNPDPKAPPFSTSESHSSSKPTSYTSAVTRNTTKRSDKTPGPDPKGADEDCTICLSNITNKKTLSKCGHSFCTGCIDKAFEHQKKCPVCSQVYGPLTGNQPDGRMIDSYHSTSLPGFGSCGTIVITYRFPSGTQGPDHPNPGKPFHGTNRTAYLPNNKEGKKVLKLLKKSFDQKLTFTIGRSTTTGRDDCVTWNDIHHKTSMIGGPTCFGYPDPKYLKRVQEELAAKRITE